MSLFRDLLSPVTEAVRLSASIVAAALGIPIALAQEAIDAGCETIADVRRYVRGRG